MQDIIPPDLNHDGLPEENLKNISYCPVCHYHYNPVQAKVLEEGNGAHLIYVKCGRCQSSILALILAGGFGISSIGLITDLDGHEALKFCHSGKISANDALAVYKFLQTESRIGRILD